MLPDEKLANTRLDPGRRRAPGYENAPTYQEWIDANRPWPTILPDENARLYGRGD